MNSKQELVKAKTMYSRRNTEMLSAPTSATLARRGSDIRPKSLNLNGASPISASAANSPMLKTGQSSTNIRVIARFRPFNALERELSDNKDVSQFESDLTVSIKHGKEIEKFTFDHVFPPTATQTEVFDKLGRPTIEDVLTGYNGTIFAFGQTGSGKTFTMMGPSMYDEELRGITPRAAAQIFDYVSMADQSESGGLGTSYQGLRAKECMSRPDPEVEFTLKCSMLEIYKETLRDLLSSEPAELKIKEDPRRGIYVQNLTEVCVIDEQEMLEVISLGEQMRTVASTRLNEVSSRSHQLFMLEVKQKLPNDSEKRGILNLVDLAGSEKVGLSGVTGNKLEEAKKINLSLSALGNVIYALVSHSEHVPYRDSKLTRLLQESLGGNYKTNLIVACSPSSKNIEETLQTLKFAQRAKHIKNKVTVNFKSSPDTYLKLIEQLKKDLLDARSQITALKGEPHESQRSSMCNTPVKPEKRKRPPRIKLLNKGDSGSESKESVEEAKLEALDSLNDRISIFESDSLSSSFHHPKSNPGLEKMLSTEKSRSTKLESEIQRLTKKVSELEQKLFRSREKQLKSEQKAHEYYECYHKTLHLINKDSSDNGVLRKQNSILAKQVRQLTEKLHELDQRFQNFIVSYHSNSGNSTILEFEDVWYKDSEEIPKESANPENEDSLFLNFNGRDLPIDCETLVISKEYSLGLVDALERNSTLNRELTIFNLKNQLIHAGLINCNLVRALTALEWKNLVLKQRVELKRQMQEHSTSLVTGLEEMIDYLHESYNTLVRHVDKLENSGFVKNSILEHSERRVPGTPRFTKLQRVITPRTTRARVTMARPTFDTATSFVTPITGSILETEDNSGLILRLRCLETHLHMQQAYNQQLKTALNDSKAETEKQDLLLKDLQLKVYESHRNEKKNWGSYLNDYKTNCDHELDRKQQEINALHEVLASWISKFIELQNSQGIPSSSDHRRTLSQQYVHELMQLVESTKRTRPPQSLLIKLADTINKSPFTAATEFTSSPDQLLRNTGDHTFPCIE